MCRLGGTAHGGLSQTALPFGWGHEWVSLAAPWGQDALPFLWGVRGVVGLAGFEPATKGL